LSPYYDLMLKLFMGSWVPRSQTEFLAEVVDRRHALIVGGGTGRFLIDLLVSGFRGRVVYLDLSPGMLERSRQRLSRQRPGDVERVEFREGTVEELRDDERFDLVCTHCFLDLFTPLELTRLMGRLDDATSEGVAWICSDFATPEGKFPRRAFQATLIRALYVFFGAVCAIAPRRLPPIRECFAALGYEARASRHLAGGILWSALYVKPGPDDGWLPRPACERLDRLRQPLES